MVDLAHLGRQSSRRVAADLQQSFGDALFVRPLEPLEALLHGDRDGAGDRFPGSPPAGGRAGKSPGS